MTAVVSGEVDLTFTSLTVAIPQAKAGKIRILGVLEGKRYSAMPNVPTVAETVPGYKGTAIWNGFMGPANMPVAVVNRLNAEFVKIQREPFMAEHLSQEGAEPRTNSPQEFGQFLRNETAKWTKVARDNNLKAE